MILSTLTLTNYGVYSQKQSIDLAPPSSERPIVLIGGLNGAGKTSILTAIQIALFGKRIMRVSHDSGSYSRLLASFVNKQEAGPTSVDLTFHVYNLGEQDTYRICRSWRMHSGGRVSEDLVAWKNGHFDEELSSTWNDFIDSLLPASIAHLFFFDGEKVAEIAHAEGARQLLSTGVQSLLGIDLLEQLDEDLANLISKKAKTQNANSNHQRLVHLENDIAELERQLTRFNEDLAAHYESLKEKQGALESVEIRFRETGAHIFLERKEIEKELAGAQKYLAEIHEELAELAAGALPLALVSDLLENVREQDVREQSAQKASAVLDVLEERDSQLLALLSEAPSDIKERVEAFIANDKVQRSLSARAEAYLNLTPEGRTQLDELDSLLAREKAEARRLIEVEEAAQLRVLNAERRLQMVPPGETVQAVIQEREGVLSSLRLEEAAIAALSKKIEQYKAVADYRGVERERVLRLVSSLQAEDTVDARIVRYAQKARERVMRFSEMVLKRALSQLEDLILDSLQQLLRKKNLVCGITIDSSDYSMLVTDGAGVTKPIDSLSAGERQLVIVSILWGLGRASGRPLPLIIDTPLGRLDSKHRNNLLDNYFPAASHQTIMLTTDTEVTEHDYELLSPFIGLTYVLTFDDEQGRTIVTPGYFWS